MKIYPTIISLSFLSLLSSAQEEPKPFELSNGIRRDLSNKIIIEEPEK